MVKKTKLAKKVKPKRVESKAPLEPRVPDTAEQSRFVELKTAEQSRVIETTAATFYLCVAENQICNKTLEIGRRFGPGQIVDLDGEMLSDGSKLRDHVRLACWRPIRAGGA